MADGPASLCDSYAGALSEERIEGSGAVQAFYFIFTAYRLVMYVHGGGSSIQ